jgi:surface polysaccharide O-acyltransferase-like enzyme
LDWNEHGVFAVQYCRPLHYLVYYVAGLAVGAYGLERGLLAVGGMLARYWSFWLAAALASVMLWMGLTGLAMSYRTSAPLFVQIVVDSSFSVACASGCFFAMAVCLRFGERRSRILDSLASNAFGMYLFHYIFVVWLQYALLGLALFAIAKASIVFGGTVLMAWATSSVMRFVPYWTRFISAARRAPFKTASVSGNFAAREIT